MKVCLINLDRAPERLATATEQLKKLGVEFERVSAVDGQAMDEKEYRRHVNRFRSWCVIGRVCNRGEVGCALSHFAAWGGETPREVTCVLEDDVLLDPRFKATLEAVEKWIDPSRPQIVLLTNHYRDTGLGRWHSGYLSEEGEAFAVEPIAFDLYAEAYVITAKAAAAIKKANYPLITPCDHWERWAKAGLIELYRAKPTVASQNKDGFASSIRQEGTRLVRDLPFHLWLLHKFKRLIGLSIEKFTLLVNA